MAWERPIGFDDEMNAWEDEAFAYDEDLDTWAKTIPLPNGIWSGWLVFTWPQFIARQLWFVVNCATARFAMDSETWDGTEWSRYEYWGDTSGPRTAHAISSAGAHSKLRIRFKHHGAGWLRGELNDVRMDRTCGGPLVLIAGFFGQVAEFVTDLADDIEDVFIIGEHLAGPFVALAGLFTSAATACCQASATLQDILDTIEGGFTWAGFLGLLQQYAPVLYYLIVDPAGEILYLIGLAFGLTPYEAQSPEFIVKTLFERYFPELYLIWRDPGSWLDNLLLQYAPVLYYLWHDPYGELLYLLAQLFDLTPYEARTPEFMVKALFERYFPTLYHLWRNPTHTVWSWLLDTFEDVFGNIAARLYYLAEHVILFFWEGTALPRAEMATVWFEGTITEAASPPVPGATVSVVGTTLSTTTDAEGQFSIRGEAVAAPSYTLRASKPGYIDTLITGVVAQPGIATVIVAGMEYSVTPPEANPAPRLTRLIEVYMSVTSKLEWTRDVLAEKRGSPTEPFWSKQVSELEEWLARACGDIQVAQTELQLYFGEAGVPSEYVSLLEFRC